MRHNGRDLRLLWFNLATDTNDPILGFTTSWLRAMASRVESIQVITMRSGQIDVPDNVHVYSVGKEKNYTKPRRVIEFYRHLVQILRKDRIHACFSHMIPLFTVLGAPILQFRGIPIVSWYAHREVSNTLKYAHHLSDRIVSINGNSYRFRHDKFTPLGHGIDTNLFSPGAPEHDKSRMILSVGRISPIKDPVTLIRAIHLMRLHGCDVRCIVIGEIPGRDRLYAEGIKKEVEDLGLNEIVQIIRPVSHYEVVHYYRRCFAHVNCSPSDHSLDKAVLEAMACERPSLSSTDSFRDTMGRWADWLLFEQSAPEDLAQKLERLLQLGVDERRRMGSDLRQSVIEHHCLERLASRLVAVLEEVSQRSAVYRTSP